MALMRELAMSREKNRESAVFSLLNIAFGMNALQSCLDGEVVLSNVHDTSSRHSVEIRKKWQWALRKVIISNKLLRGTKHYVAARKKARQKDPYLGYMITNFNHVTFENGDSLELLLDWFEVANQVFQLPEKVMQRLLKEDKEQHAATMIRAEQTNAKAAQLDREDAARHDIVSDEGYTSHRPKMYVPPWDEDLAIDKIKRTSAAWKSIDEITKLMWNIGAAQERYQAKMRTVGRMAMLFLTDPESNHITINQARVALQTHLMSLKVMSVGLDSSLEVLRDPDADIVKSYEEMGALSAALKQQRFINKMLHDNIKQLMTDKQEIQDEMERRSKVANTTITDLRETIATMQDELDRHMKSIADLQVRNTFLKNTNADLESTLEGLASVQEMSSVLFKEIKELKAKVADRDTKLVELGDLRSHLAQARQRVAELTRVEEGVEELHKEFAAFRLAASEEKGVMQRMLDDQQKKIKGMETQARQLERQVQEGRAIGVQGVAHDAKAALRKCSEDCVTAINGVRASETTSVAVEMAGTCMQRLLLAALSPLEDQGMEPVMHLCKHVIKVMQETWSDMLKVEYEKGADDKAVELGMVDFEAEKEALAKALEDVIVQNMLATLEALNAPNESDESIREDEGAPTDAVRRKVQHEADSALSMLSCLAGALEAFMNNLKQVNQTSDDFENAAEDLQEALQSKVLVAQKALLSLKQLLAVTGPQAMQAALTLRSRRFTTEGRMSLQRQLSMDVSESGFDADPEELMSSLIKGTKRLIAMEPPRRLLFALHTACDKLLPHDDDDEKDIPELRRVSGSLELPEIARLSSFSRRRTTVDSPQSPGPFPALESVFETHTEAEASPGQSQATCEVSRQSNEVPFDEVRDKEGISVLKRISSEPSLGSGSAAGSASRHTAASEHDTAKSECETPAAGGDQDRSLSGAVQRVDAACSAAGGMLDAPQHLIADAETSTETPKTQAQACETEGSPLAQVDDNSERGDEARVASDTLQSGPETEDAGAGMNLAGLGSEVASIETRLSALEDGCVKVFSSALQRKVSKASINPTTFEACCKEIEALRRQAQTERASSSGTWQQSPYSTVPPTPDTPAPNMARPAPLVQTSLASLREDDGSTPAEADGSLLSDTHTADDSAQGSPLESPGGLASPGGEGPKPLHSPRKGIMTQPSASHALEGVEKRQAKRQVTVSTRSLAPFGESGRMATFKQDIELEQAEHAPRSTSLRSASIAQKETTMTEAAAAAAAVAPEAEISFKIPSNASETQLGEREVHASPQPKKHINYASTIALYDDRDIPHDAPYPQSGDESWDLSGTRHSHRRASASPGGSEPGGAAAPLASDDGIVEGKGLGLPMRDESPEARSHGEQRGRPKSRRHRGRSSAAYNIDAALPQTISAYAPYGHKLPWRFTEPELPANYAARTESRAAPDEEPSVRQVFAHLAGKDDYSELKATWLSQLSQPANTEVFDRMKRELTELNALYSRALQSAGILAQLNADRLLNEEAIQQLRAVEGSEMMSSIAAMDSINALDPLKALAMQEAEAFEKEIEQCYAALMGDAAKWMDTMHDLPMMQRHRRMLESSLRARAQTIIASKRQREDTLSYSKRVDRSSVFVPEAELRGQSRRDPQKGQPMRWAKNNFKHGAVYSSLCDIDLPLMAVPAATDDMVDAGDVRPHTATDILTTCTDTEKGKTARSELAVGRTLIDARTLRGRRGKADHQGRPRVFEAKRSPSKGKEAPSSSALPPLDKRSCVSLDHRAIAAAAAAVPVVPAATNT